MTFGSQVHIAGLKNAGFSMGAIYDNRVEIFVQGSADAFVKTLARCEVIDLESRTMTIEQVFMQYYGKEASA